MKKEERQRPALGEERRADHGLPVNRPDLEVNHAPSRIVRPILTAAAVMAALSAIFVTAQILGRDDHPPARQEAALAPATSTAKTTSATPVPTPRPTPAATPTTAPLDPGLVSDGILMFVAPDGSLRTLAGDRHEDVIAENVLHPAIHPGRDAVAFVRYDGVTSEIWIWQQGTGAELLGSRDGLVRNLEWNADGDALLYHVQDDAATTTIIRQYDFFWESAETLLASDQFSSEGASIQGFDVFPDGRLAVQVTVLGDESSCGIFVVEADLSEAERLTPREDGVCHSHPSVSPDGEQVAFITREAGDAAYVAVIDTDGDGYRRLASITTLESGGGPFWPRIAWSPDSEIVLYETLEEEETVYAQAADDTAGETRRLVAHGHHPTWQ